MKENFLSELVSHLNNDKCKNHMIWLVSDFLFVTSRCFYSIRHECKVCLDKYECKVCIDKINEYSRDYVYIGNKSKSDIDQVLDKVCMELASYN